MPPDPTRERRGRTGPGDSGPCSPSASCSSPCARRCLQFRRIDADAERRARRRRRPARHRPRRRRVDLARRTRTRSACRRGTCPASERNRFELGDSFFTQNWVTAPGHHHGPRRSRTAVQRRGVRRLSRARRPGEPFDPTPDGEAPSHRYHRRDPRPRPAAPAQRSRDRRARRTEARSGLRRPVDRPGDPRGSRRGTGRRSPRRRRRDRSPTAPPTRCPTPTYSIADPAYGPLAGGSPDLTPGGAADDRHRPARGHPGGGASCAGPTPTTPTTTESPDGSTPCGTAITGRRGARSVRVEGQRPHRRAADGERIPRRHRDHVARHPPTRTARRRRPRASAAIDGGAPEIDRTDLRQRRLLHPGGGGAEASAGCGARPNATAPSCSSRRGARPVTPRPQPRAIPTSRPWPNQTIHPFTDLLLHDMGEGLSDGRPDFEAGPTEWRTAPLWGIGLYDEVNGHTRFLHDGRARNLEEAILWHGGEAADAAVGLRRDGRSPIGPTSSPTSRPSDRLRDRPCDLHRQPCSSSSG